MAKNSKGERVDTAAQQEARQKYNDKKALKIRRRDLNIVNQLLTPTQRLEALDKRLGKGKGAVKERARLKALLG